MHTSYETILLQRFQDMGHYFDLEGYKDTISNKYKKLMVSSYIHSHITLQPKTGCPQKLSRVEPGQYLDGRPPGKTR